MGPRRRTSNAFPPEQYPQPSTLKSLPPQAGGFFVLLFPVCDCTIPTRANPAAMEPQMDYRPPSPWPSPPRSPRGEGERFAAFGLSEGPGCGPHSGVIPKAAATATLKQPFQERRVLFSLSSGERAGVRADVSLTPTIVQT